MLVAACLCITACKGSKVLLRSDYYSFDTSTEPTAVLPADGGDLNALGGDFQKGFTMVVPVRLSAST